MNISCHIHPPRRLLQVLLLACVLCAGTGCTAWHEAQTVIREADSLDTRGIIYPDTAALQQFICTWDKPGLNLLMHNSLGKAYYYLGRNREDRYQQYVEAAECYIRSDQLHMSDPVRRGRVNSCMGYLCGNADKKCLNLAFAQRALHHFRQGNNDTYISNQLLYIMQIYSYMGDYHRADSIARTVSLGEKDSVTMQQLYLHRGWCFYHKGEYDSALVAYQQALQYTADTDTNQWYICDEMMAIHYRLGNLDSAVYYAQSILNDIYNPAFHVNAYYVLMDDATGKNDAKALSDYAHERADMHQLFQKEKNDYVLAASLLENYLDNPSSILSTIVTISLGAVLLIACIVIGIWSWRKYHKRLLDTQQHASKLEKQLADIDREKEKLRTQKRDAVEKVLLKNKETFDFDSAIWSDDEALCQTADRQLYNIYTRLYSLFAINTQDLKICILTLYGASRIQISEKTFRAVSSVPKLRANTAKKLGTTSANLRTFLIDFMTL